MTGTWSLSTWTTDLVQITVDGEVVEFTQDGTNIPTCTVDFNAYLDQWISEHPGATIASANGDSSNASGSSSTGSNGGSSASSSSSGASNASSNTSNTTSTGSSSNGSSSGTGNAA